MYNLFLEAMQLVFYAGVVLTVVLGFLILWRAIIKWVIRDE